MRTALIILGGFVLLGVFALAARLAGGDAADKATIIAAQVFIPVWIALAGVNLWVGVTKAGFTVAQELPIFLLIFALPAAAAACIWWYLS